MREILFRGKRTDNGEWVYGYFVKMLWEYSIIPLEDENTVYPVDPETVGQYTGLTDKNGKKIFEGDIISKNRVIIRKVEWEEDSTGFFPFTVIEDGGRAYVDAEECEVIGNVNDNKELLNNVEAHHNDYNKPLEIRWLCRNCHREWHKEHDNPELMEVKDK